MSAKTITGSDGAVLSRRGLFALLFAKQVLAARPSLAAGAGDKSPCRGFVFVSENKPTARKALAVATKNKPRARRAAGFTLLELLVSITVVSLLATAILFGWRIAISAWQAANDRLREDRKVLATHQILAEQVASMSFFVAQTPAGPPELFFEGDRRTARFLSRYSLAHRAQSGLFRVEYQVEQQPDGTQQLLLNEFPLTSEKELGSLVTGAEVDPSGGRILQFSPFRHGPETVTLLEGLKECRFEYYRPPRPPAPGAWMEQWQNLENQLPSAMAIRLVAGSGSAGLQSVSVVAAIRNSSRMQEPRNIFGFLRRGT